MVDANDDVSDTVNSGPLEVQDDKGPTPGSNQPLELSHCVSNTLSNVNASTLPTFRSLDNRADASLTCINSGKSGKIESPKEDPSVYLQHILFDDCDRVLHDEVLEGHVRFLALIAGFFNESKAYDDCREIGKVLLMMGKIDPFPFDKHNNVEIQTAFDLLIHGIVSVEQHSNATTCSAEWKSWRMHRTWLLLPTSASPAKCFLLALLGTWFNLARYHRAASVCAKQSTTLYQALPNSQQSRVLQHAVSTFSAFVISDDPQNRSEPWFNREWSSSQLTTITRLLSRNIVCRMHELLAWCIEVATDFRLVLRLTEIAQQMHVTKGQASASDTGMLEKQVLFCCLSHGWWRIREKKVTQQTLTLKERKVLNLLETIWDELILSAFEVLAVVAARATISAPTNVRGEALTFSSVGQLCQLQSEALKDGGESWRIHIARKWCQCWLWQGQDSTQSCGFDNLELAAQVHRWSRSFAIQHFNLFVDEPSLQSIERNPDDIANFTLVESNRLSQISDDFAGFKASARRLSDASMASPYPPKLPSAGLSGLYSAASSIRKMWKFSPSTSSVRSKNRFSTSQESLQRSVESMSISENSLKHFSVSSGRTHDLRKSVIMETGRGWGEEATRGAGEHVSDSNGDAIFFAGIGTFSTGSGLGREVAVDDYNRRLARSGATIGPSSQSNNTVARERTSL